MRPIQMLLLGVLTATFVAAQDQSRSDLSADLYAAYLKHLSPIQRDLLAAFDKIAAERGIKVAEVHRVYRAMNCDSQGMTKGGVGIIRDRVFVVVGSEKNEAIAGENTAVGADCHLPELFVFSGGKFVGRLPIPADATSDVIVALFTPEKVQFYDWRDFTGGCFKRWREDEPNPVQPTPTAVTPPAAFSVKATEAKRQEARQP